VAQLFAMFASGAPAAVAVFRSFFGEKMEDRNFF
jgi:hypothetical protein